MKNDLSKRGPGGVSLMERIFWVDFASFQRTYNYRDSTYAYNLAIMVMFSRVGFPILAAIVVAWIKVGALIPVIWRIQNLSANARLIFGCAFVLATYAWLYRRFSPCLDRASTAESHDTPTNRRLAALSMALAVGSPLLGWLAIRFMRSS
jgi:hypothetical protein